MPRSFSRLIDELIARGEAAGLFKDLPGAGKPLDLDDDSLVPEEDRLGYRVLKNAGFAPPWIELQKSIFEEQERLAAWLARANQRWSAGDDQTRARLRADYERKLADLNRLICSYNLMIPPVVGQLPTLQLWRELRKLGEE
jgi:hypothetical protein